MKRNQEDEPVSIVRFSRTNPPSSKESALARIDVLDETIVQIETQLDHRSQESFENIDAYEGWRKRAMDAHGYARVERRFLRHWLEDREREVQETAQRKAKAERQVAKAARKMARRDEAKQAFHPPDGSELSIVAKRIRERARELADELEREYAPIYSATSLPPNLTTAENRQAQLIAMKLRIQGAFGEITASWSEHSLHPRALPGVKLPLSRIYAQVEMELLVLRPFISDAKSKEPRHDWKTLCLNALERAVAGGFQLTSDEQIVFDQMKALRTLQGS